MSETIFNRLKNSSNLFENMTASKGEIQLLEAKISNLEKLIRSYENISNDQYDTDDEIINWTLPEIISELHAAISNLALHHYKQVASISRIAFDMAIHQICLQLLQNNDANRRQKLPVEFNSWDNGSSDTPNWNFYKLVLNGNLNIQSFDQNGGDIVLKWHKIFKELSNYVHSRAFDQNGEATTTMNMNREDFYSYNEVLFGKYSNVIHHVIDEISFAWIIVFPELAQIRKE
jgi:hypothetical protein